MSDTDKTELDIDESPDNYEMYDPCPQCGEDEEFVQTTLESEIVRTDGDGDIRDIEKMDSFEVLTVSCYECDQLLYGER